VHFNDWPGTLDSIAAFEPMALSPGRGEALVGRDKVTEAIVLARNFVTTTYRSVARVVARGGSLEDADAACRAECDPKFHSLLTNWN
jgi:hypothetical protein